MSAIAWFAAIPILFLASNVAQAGDSCKSSPQDAAAVVETLQSWFSALQKGDMERANALTTSTFYAYDARLRFDGTALSRAIAQMQAGGQSFEWKLSSFDTHVSCDLAWVAYRNEGGVRKGNEFTPRAWLESAVFERGPQGWRLTFLHSTSVDP